MGERGGLWGSVWGPTALTAGRLKCNAPDCAMVRVGGVVEGGGVEEGRKRREEEKGGKENRGNDG